MLRDITIGQYYNTKSCIHSLDPRCKLILLLVMMVAIFMVNSLAGYCTMIALT
ncbi:MAG: energy-coupling factor transporter transmembrane protein EcfT, partial [Clostridia bacterium]|nr:energy-coupling factor transporter transmembrane protein EcfT [Clostridia bacterium]